MQVVIRGTLVVRRVPLEVLLGGVVREVGVYRDVAAASAQDGIPDGADDDVVSVCAHARDVAVRAVQEGVGPSSVARLAAADGAEFVGAVTGHEGSVAREEVVRPDPEYCSEMFR